MSQTTFAPSTAGIALLVPAAVVTDFADFAVSAVFAASAAAIAAASAGVRS